MRAENTAASSGAAGSATARSIDYRDRVYFDEAARIGGKLDDLDGCRRRLNVAKIFAPRPLSAS
jgi:hypothetical protein